MAITAVIKDGKLDSTGATTDTTGTTNKNGTTAVDEDMFLQLLVAEMKYQDPMQPTSNTEWVSQYATFSQVEKLTGMQQSVTQSQAGNLVGKQVIMKTTNEAGETTYASGKVDYLYVENGKSYLYINGKQYSMDELDSVVDDDYMNAITKKADFENMMDKLPGVNSVTLADESLVSSVRKSYDAMSDYEKTFISSDLTDTLKALEAKIAQLKAAAGGAN